MSSSAARRRDRLKKKYMAEQSRLTSVLTKTSDTLVTSTTPKPLQPVEVPKTASLPTPIIEQSAVDKNEPVRVSAAVSASPTATAIAVDSDEASEFAHRLEKWRPSFAEQLQDGDQYREHLFQQVVLQSLRIERAQRREFELIDGARRRAHLAWDADRESLAETIGATLARKPGLGVAKLRTFYQGGEWLIRQWQQLKTVIQAAGKATPEQAEKIQDLLGSSLFGRIERPDGLPLAEALPLIDGALEPLIATDRPRLKLLDDDDRAAAESGFAAETSREERLNRRYEDLAQRRYHEAKALLEFTAKAQPTTPSTPKPPPEPTRLDSDSNSNMEKVLNEALEELKVLHQSFDTILMPTTTANTPRRNEPSGKMAKLSPTLTPSACR